ncbi:MAG: FAD-dependent oxidoreductase [Actinomycetota bacterium]|nr:FAD-dependent oxidoreductase [Actinomycetota bacterium]
MRVAVVGGGIAGLAAAWELTGGPQPAEVTVLEPGPLGGRIRTETFLGHPVDTAADAFIARVPEGVQLARELGLESELVAPAARQALLWIGGRLRPLPDGLVLGAPARLRPLLASGILSPAGVLRAGLDLVLPRSRWPEDVAVARLVGGRFGRQVAERLVDPLVGGIHAGSTENLSADSTAPQLARAARGHRSLLLGLRALPPPPDGPLFLAPRAGMGRLVERLVEALTERGVHFEPVAADAVRGGKGDPVVVDPLGTFDAAVLATPARVTAKLVNNCAPDVASALRGIRSSSVVLATLAYRRSDLAVPDGASGWLVARNEGRLMTACSFGSAKWPHWSDPGTMVLRVSAGRAGDERALQLSEGALIDHLQGEVAAALATTATPFHWRVSQWREAFPQYEVGHRARVMRIESALPGPLPRVALAGASLRGSGIPACVASGRQAALRVTAPASGT